MLHLSYRRVIANNCLNWRMAKLSNPRRLPFHTCFWGHHQTNQISSFYFKFQGFVFEALIIFSLVMGLFDGCFISLLGPIAFEIVGPAGASQAIRFLLSLCSIPLTVGPPIAGVHRHTLDTHQLAKLPMRR